MGVILSDPPFTFRYFLRGVTRTILASGGEVNCKVFGRETPQQVAEGASLDNFGDFSQKLCLKMQQKAKIWIYKVKSFSLKFFREVIEESNPKKLFSGKIF